MVVQFIVFLTLSTLICRGTDISKCFSESLGIRDNESRLYFHSSCLFYTCFIKYLYIFQQILYEKLTVETEHTEERSLRSSPFSARAAFQQTQQILTSTKDTTKAVLSSVTDTKWWQGTIHKLKQPTKRQTSLDFNDRNKKMELQSCHPFYDGMIEHCYSNVVSCLFISSQNA